MGDRTKLELPDTFAAIALLVLGSCCALLLLTQERRIGPRDLPSLRLPAADVAAAIADDQRRAAQAPTSKTAVELEALLHDLGEAETAVVEPAATHRARSEALAETLHRLVEEEGKDAGLALRARAVSRMEAALRLELPEEQIAGVMGAFAHTLQDSEVTRDGAIIGPHFVVRTLYKTRWNLAHGLPSPHAFSKVERLAYYGWLALHARRAALPLRLQALQPYADAGGQHVEQAAGVLLFAAQQYGTAGQVLQKAYEDDASVRLRNYTLGARVAAGIED